MTLKGRHVEGANATSLEALTATAVNILTPSTGRTFVLTDLIVIGRATAITTPATMPVVRFYDETAGGSTAPTASSQKFAVAIPTIAEAPQESTAGATAFQAAPLVIRDIQNGPEFSTAVSAASIGLTHFVISAYAIWVGGVER